MIIPGEGRIDGMVGRQDRQSQTGIVQYFQVRLAFIELAFDQRRDTEIQLVALITKPANKRRITASCQRNINTLKPVWHIPERLLQGTHQPQTKIWC